MEKVVIYATKAGTSAAVAEKIAQEQKAERYSYKEMPSLTKEQAVIYVGSIYAGQILGLEKVAKRLATASEVTLVTVGLMAPELAETQKLRAAAIKKAQSKGDFLLGAHFPLQGSLDLDKLSFPQRTLIKAMYKQGKKNPTGELGAIVTALENSQPFEWTQVTEVLQKLSV